MKKFLVTVGALAVASTLVACGGGGDGDSPKNDIIIQDSSDSPGNTSVNSPGDSTLNQNLATTIMQKTSIAPGEACESGGVEIHSGVDSNGNGRLEQSEIIETQTVCHGSSGYNSLVTITDEPVGINCVDGGKTLAVGQDTNRNTVLDDDEVENRSYVCNGLKGSDGQAGADGQVGANGGASGVACSIQDNSDGEKILVCADGSTILVQGGIVYQSTKVDNIPGGFQITDSWASSGGQDRFSYRNLHYLFNVTESGNITIEIESAVSNYLYLINALGIVVKEGRGNTLSAEVASGNSYRVVAATNSVSETSNYTLKLLGNIEDVGKVDSQSKSVEGSWTSSGGQLKDSYRNDHYTFNVTADNSYIDILVQSNVANHLYLINSNDVVVKKTGDVSSGDVRLRSEVSAGSYKLVVATYFLGEIDSYDLTVVGEFSNLTKKSVPNPVEKQASWSPSGGQDRTSANNPSYSFDMTEDNIIDMTISSNVSNYLYLINSNDVVVEEASNVSSGDVRLLTGILPSGRYTVVAATYFDNEESNFTLTVYGQIANFTEN